MMIQRFVFTLGLAIVLANLVPSRSQAETCPPPAISTLTSTDLNNLNGLFQEGVNDLSRNNYEVAIATFTQVIQLAPCDPAPYINRGIARQNLEDYDEAIADFNQAIKVNPRSVLAYINRGMVHYHQNAITEANADFNQAIIFLEEARESDQSVLPMLTTAYGNRGDIRLMQRQWNDAIEDYTQVIQLAPDKAKAYFNRGVAYSNSERQMEAKEDFRQAANLYRQQGNAEAAQRAESAVAQ
jgi:tetratricopeptide (TPR) repeat protein